MNLIEEIDKQLIDYDAVKSNSIFKIPGKDEEYDLNFIITVRDRVNFKEPLFEAFLKACEKVDKKISYTVVEHSQRPDHSKYCKKNKINYIFIPAEHDELFNKCLAYNFGALFSVKAKYHLFHDIDILMQSSFFEDIFTYIDRDVKALQCYTGRRVINCNVEMTIKLITGEVDVDVLDENTYGVDYPRFNGEVALGSTGGSILVENDLFEEIGGFDPELFKAYSAEDQFFWNKLLTKVDIEYADNPAIELFHMWHEPQFNKNPRLLEMENYMIRFKELSKKEKEAIVSHKKEILKNINRDA